MTTLHPDDDVTEVTVTGFYPVSGPQTIIRFVGESANEEIQFGVDHRPAQDLVDAIGRGEDVIVYIEPWQIIARKPLVGG